MLDCLAAGAYVVHDCCDSPPPQLTTSQLPDIILIGEWLLRVLQRASGGLVFKRMV